MEEKLDVMEALIAAGADVNETEGDIGLPMITRAVVSDFRWYDGAAGTRLGA